MTTECYYGPCKHHESNDDSPDNGPFCHEDKCHVTNPHVDTLLRIQRVETVDAKGELDQDESGSRCAFLLWEQLPMPFTEDDYSQLFAQIEKYCVEGAWRDAVISELRELQGK